MNILQINSSARSQGSLSTRLADRLTATLRAATPATSLTVRDLAAQPHPPLDEDALQALFTPADARSAEQSRRVSLDDALIAEVKAADVVVIGAPMYNFGVSTQLKNWIDAISRAKVTFEYTAQGPRGLLTGKQVYVVLTRGGRYRDTAADSQVPYLRTVLAFLGMTDVEFVYAEGVAMGPDAERDAIADAERQIEEALAVE